MYGGRGVGGEEERGRRVREEGGGRGGRGRESEGGRGWEGRVEGE